MRIEYHDKFKFRETLVEAMAWVGAETADNTILDQAREVAERIGDPQTKSYALAHFAAAKNRFEELTRRRVALNLSRQIGDAVQSGDWRGVYDIVLRAPDLPLFEGVSLMVDILEAWANRQKPALEKAIANANGDG